MVVGAGNESNATRGVTEPLGHQVARHLFDGTEVEEQLALPYTAASLLEDTRPTAPLVVADGSARRTEKAPGHLHPGASPSMTRSSRHCAQVTPKLLRRSTRGSPRSSGVKECRASTCSARWPGAATSRPP